MILGPSAGGESFLVNSFVFTCDNKMLPHVLPPRMQVPLFFTIRPFYFIFKFFNKFIPPQPSLTLSTSGN